MFSWGKIKSGAVPSWKLNFFTRIHVSSANKNNQLTSWPEFLTKLITKNLPPTIATSKGHINQERQNIKYTKPKKRTRIGSNLLKIQLPILNKKIYMKGNISAKYCKLISLTIP